MNLFETVKSAVTVKQAAEYYGCKVNRGDMICCPFHDDRHPSMKLNRDYFYCFGCGATGDVIDFVARLFGLRSYEAAKKLAYDFGIDPDKPPAAMALKKPYPLARAFRNDEIHCQRVLCDYLHLLERWKVEYAPQSPEDELDDRFVEACHMIEYVNDLLDVLMFAELKQRVKTVVLLSHKKADSYIHIDVEFGEGEGKIPVDSIAKRAEAYKPKEKVTYKMIKEYIEAKYGFKVHTAYIAEVKRNLGLPMYDAPNAVEELKQPRKHPTPEKVEAIKDALRYFAVI